MITFHNDHLVSPVLCELLYNTVDEHLHRPVIFVPGKTDLQALGRCYYRYIEIYLHEIFICEPPEIFRLWKDLLCVAYHEFGHIATARLARHVNRQEYESKERGYRYTEQLANNWAKESILRLLEKDKRLFQPPSLGAYYDKHLRKELKLAKKFPGRIHMRMLFREECGKFISGGQLSAGDVATMIDAWKYSQSPVDKSKRVARPNYELIYKLADDLAYFYIDRAGCRYGYFAYGDVPEIAMRLARYEATHKPTRSFLEYQAQQDMSVVPESN